jgi:2-oxoglutarate dehydrogenase complex dehydrogenase (E1) component-like enzyme
VFNTSNTFFGKETMSLRELRNALRETYCGTIGAEYMYMTDQAQEALVAAETRVDPQQAQFQRRPRSATSWTG